MSINVNYGEFDAIMHSDIKSALRSRRHYLGDNNAYPTYLSEPQNGNFEQISAKKRFNDLVAKYRQAAKLPNQMSYQGITALPRNIAIQSYSSVMQSCEIEKPNYAELEKLAVDIVRKDFNIKENEIIFNVKIVGFGNVEFPENMKTEKEHLAPPKSINYDATDEVQKRRFINALISGASKKGHYIFHLGKEQLDRINPALIPLYQLLMSANDLMYYMIPDKVASAASATEGAKAGFEKITFDDNDTPIITVEAINFPTLLHEIIKAVVELIATLALPDDKKLLEFVYDESDFILAEMWYLRLGPVYWERLLNCFPIEHMDIKSILLGKVFEQSTNDFNVFMRYVLSDNDTGVAKTQLLNWAKKIKDDIRRYNQKNI